MAKSDYKSICFRLNSQSSKDYEYLVRYLHEYQPNISPNQKIARATELTYLALAIPPEHQYYRSLVLESLSFHHSRINLLENVSGISLKQSNFQSMNSMPIYLSYGSTQSMTQPMAEVITNPVSTPAVVETSQVEPNPIEPTLSSIQELETKLDSLFEELLPRLQNGEHISKISATFDDLLPEDEEAWTDEMWELYDQTKQKIFELKRDDRELES